MKTNVSQKVKKRINKYNIIFYKQREYKKKTIEQISVTAITRRTYTKQITNNCISNQLNKNTRKVIQNVEK